MRIISHHNHHYLHVGCLVCGQRCELGTEVHDAYDDDGDHLGSICDACMALTPAERRVTMHAQADALRAEADDLDALAEDVWLLERTDGFIDVKTGVPHDNTGPCDHCISPQEVWAQVARYLNAPPPEITDDAAEDVRDEDIPF
jgi:hypothetical protein